VFKNVDGHRFDDGRYTAFRQAVPHSSVRWFVANGAGNRAAADRHVGGTHNHQPTNCCSSPGSSHTGSLMLWSSNSTNTASIKLVKPGFWRDLCFWCHLTAAAHQQWDKQ
jgi:hypothetical protein